MYFLSLADQNSFFGSSLVNKYVFTHYIKMGMTFPEDWHNSSALAFHLSLCLCVSLMYIGQAGWTTAACQWLSTARGAMCEDTCVDVGIDDARSFLGMCVWHPQLCWRRRSRRCPFLAFSCSQNVKTQHSNVRLAPELRVGMRLQERSPNVFLM